MTDRGIARVAAALAHAWTWGVGFWVYRTFVEWLGLGAVLAPLFPILVSGLFLAVAVSEPGGRAVTIGVLWLTAIVMLGFCVLAGFSIGLLYIPGAVAMLIAGAFAASSTASSAKSSAGRVTRGCL